MQPIGINLMYLRPGHVGGSEVYCRQLIAGLATLGLPLRLYCTQETADTFSGQSGVDLRVLASGSYGLRQRLWAENYELARELRRDPVGVLHSPGNFGAPFLPSRVPQVITIHDLQHLHVPELFAPQLRLQRTAWFRASILRSAHVIAISSFTRVDVMTHFGVRPDDITVILEGVHRGTSVPDEELQAAHRTTYGLAQPFVYYPATENAHKNHELLLDALARLESSPLELVLTGRQGPRWSEIEAHAHRVGVRHRVRHLGFVPRAHVFDLMHMARALVFPSLFEGFGLPVLEAMQCDTPALVSNAASLPEVAGDAAILLSPRDPAGWAEAMDRIDSDEALRADLVSRGHANLERFSWQRCAEETAEVYDRVR